MSKRIWLIASIVVFAFLGCARVWHLAHRTEFIGDETYSYMLARHNVEYVKTMPDTVLTGRALSQLPHCNHPYFEDIASLHSSNLDTPHASLYYMCLRTALMGVDEYSPQQIIARGGVLNMLFWAMAFWLVFMLARTGAGMAQWAIPVVLLVAFGNPLSIANTMMVREYQLAEAMLVALALVVMRITAAMPVVSMKSWILLILCGVGAMSSGYLNAYFVLMLFVWLAVRAVKLKASRRVMWRIALCGVLILAFCWVIYTGYFNFILVPTAHTRHAFSDFGGAFKLAFIQIYLKSILTVPGVVVLAAGILVVLMCGRERALKTMIYIVFVSVSAIFAMVMAEYTSLLRAVRYAYPFAALSTLWILSLIACVGRRQAVAMSLAISAVVLYSCFTTQVNANCGWQNMRRQLRHGAIIYSLNNNELVLLSPCVADDAQYIITSNDSVLTDTTSTPIVARRNVRFTPPRKATRLHGPLYVHNKD